MSHALNDPDLQALVVDTLAGTPAAEIAVICLCAAWCGTCREFEPVFTAVGAAHPCLTFRWIDIEDEADILGDVDVQTFPTLVIGSRDGDLRFAGPVLPQSAQITRLLDSVLRA